MTNQALGKTFQEALLYALKIHGDDVRKSSTIPYVSHLFSVCALVLENGGSEDEAIAALLHDTLEDHPDKVKKEDLEERFGTSATEIVLLCTDTPPDYQGGAKPPWHERKAAYVERLRKETYPLCRVALADKLHNIRTIVSDYRQIGDAVWKRFKADKENQLRYHKALVEAFREAKAPAHLVEELDYLVGVLEGEQDF